ncbi:aldehyde dehydrogenase family protein, partial [Phenylobacterium sp.]|uniref:aldehyde dehydrogenase family protein n=1 Tax=Phenylobacterium sp. TaxID=1871053 RepID=UPI00286BE049
MDDAAAIPTAETAAPRTGRLERLAPGQAIPFGGDRVAFVSEALAAAFEAGDRLVVVEGELLHVPAGIQTLAADAVGRAHKAFQALAAVSDAAITQFFEVFAANLADEGVWAAISAANAADVATARARGRSTTRLAVSEAMRRDMIAGLEVWRDAPASRGRVLERVEHAGWSVEQVAAPLGVVGFIFEGRPNVFADATGVLRTGNTVVFRIGSDALGTARAIVEHALNPALRAAGLPVGAAALVDSPAHAAGWAMFSDPRLALAVARGSGPAVAQLGAIARQVGTPVSLHGTGGAWIVADASADPERLKAAVYHSLDRKVCNTLNVCAILRDRAADHLPAFLEALTAAGERRRGVKLHVVAGGEALLPAAWRDARVVVGRAQGPCDEAQIEILSREDLGREWEWEETPELSLVFVENVEEAVGLFNRYSPQFAASLIAEDAEAHERFYAAINAPFVGDGFTRWVDGQFALDRPELGLSNWEHGRLFARGGVLSGDGVFTVRARVRQTDVDLDRNPDTARP